MPRIILEAAHLLKSFGDQTVLDVDQIRIFDGERIALIGENGVGKSTLLSIFSGESEPDSGTVRHYGSFAIIHQSGETRMNGNAHLISEFRVPDARSGLSGGELTRRRIVDALSQNTQLLFADEPTTDLDAGGVERLRQFLMSYRGALVLVSHDRSLLDALCTRVLHLEDGRITDFPGTYAEYRAELERRRAHQQFEYDQYRAEQSRLKAMAQQKAEWAASVQKAPKRMGNSEARLHTREFTNAVIHQSAAKRVVQNRMDRLEKKERPRDLPEIRMTLGAARPVEAKTAISVQCDSLQAGNRTLISRAQFSLPSGSRTALLGDNGSGKTTLLRIIRGEHLPGISFSGNIRVNPGVCMGIFDQDHAKTLNLDETVLCNVLSSSQLPESMARTVLARLGLQGDTVFKPVRVLSGGERAKIALAKLLLSENNLLILDEPTNHLDIFTMEALETMLADYGGTLLFVSHDRAFTSAVANRILTIDHGNLSVFEGSLKQMTEDAGHSRSTESLQIEISALEMRMAALTARMSAPKKGDRPGLLSEQYDTLAAELRALKQAAEHSDTKKHK
ncbi:MAG: ABC-F family ATP-binding cassette domain-containing protein [Clostridia bacterium]|nr:ABC-F family ATP-binding cassette domain-containing protein [Clostridia bacterium]